MKKLNVNSELMQNPNKAWKIGLNLSNQLKNNIEDAIGGDKGGRGQLGKAMTDTLNKTLTDMGDPLTRNLARFICSSEVMKVIKTKVSDLVPGF